MSSPCFAVSLVTFDVGGTLLTLRPDQAEEWSRVLAEAGLAVPAERIGEAMAAERPRAAERRRLAVAPDHRVSPEAGEARRRAFIAGVLDGSGLADAELARGVEAVKAALDSPRMYVPYDDALPTLRELAERGLKLGAIANAWPSLPKVLMAFGFDQFLGFWLISEFVGVEKPAAAIFERALDRAATPADKALHVGDDPETDIRGARAAGVESVLLLRHDAPNREARAEVARELRVPIIEQLTELPDRIP
jgi:putative hydrolase of the HAD superfamily